MKRYNTSRKPLRVTKPAAMDPEKLDKAQALTQLRVHIYNQALQTLAIVRTLLEEAPTAHPDRMEMSEASRIVREALVEAGLDLIRPIVAELKRAGLKPLAQPADTENHGGANSTVPAALDSANSASL